MDYEGKLLLVSQLPLLLVIFLAILIIHRKQGEPTSRKRIEAFGLFLWATFLVCWLAGEFGVFGRFGLPNRATSSYAAAAILLFPVLRGVKRNGDEDEDR